MKPKAFIGLILLAISIHASIFSWPASATSFDSILAGPPQMIVVTLSVSAQDQQTNALIPQLELQSKLEEYALARFRDEGLDIRVAQIGEYPGPPKGIHPQNVVMVFVRADLVSMEVRSKTTIIGAVSVIKRRDTDVSWSRRPYTFFSAENEIDVGALARKAAIDQFELDVIEPIVSQAK
jgi:hypothetical protein